MNTSPEEGMNDSTLLSKDAGTPEAGWRKRFHAWMMARGNSKYEKTLAARKRELFRSISGNVLEIGAGTGPNLAYYPKDIHLVGIEPNPFMHKYLRKEAQRLGMAIDVHEGTAENVGLRENSVDAVVGTLVLCSVPDVPRTLKEILRVLKPGGRFYFVEHVAAPRGTVLRRIQRWVHPFWKRIADGCHPDRETWNSLEEAGFGKVTYDRFNVPAPVVGPHIAGVAVKKSA
jgi:ubiquinone/menaquinone biosynthesis C-methylase UbiE